ncbi:MAG: hypothetical protein PHG64_15450 [Paludibacter sp.]|nr:hypothetical protein [Paludibacter sp.]
MFERRDYRGIAGVSLLGGEGMTQQLIINSINFTFGKKQYQIELDSGHIWDISVGDFDETNIYLGGGLSSMIQECVYRIAHYEKHQNDWNDQEDDE